MIFRNDVKKAIKEITRFNLFKELKILINIFRILQGQNDFCLLKSKKTFRITPY
jgi:hypothetical protein